MQPVSTLITKQIGKTAAGRMIKSGLPSKTRISEGYQDAKSATRRLVKRTRHAAEDLMDDFTHQIKHYPLRSVGIALGAGAILGVLVSRNGRR